MNRNLTEFLSQRFNAIGYAEEYPPTLGARLLAKRGLNDDPEDWTAPDAVFFDQLADRFIDTFPQLRALFRLLRSGRRHVVYGDTDADGLIAQWIISDCLGAIGEDWEARIYKRTADGYGVHAAYFQDLPSNGLIWLLDLGSGDFAPVEALLSRAPVCIIDHHQMDEAVYRAAETGRCIVIHHQLDDSFLEGASKTSSGMLAFLTALAIRKWLRQENEPTPIPEERLFVWLEAAAASVVADMMPLRGFNRRMVRRAIAAANHDRGRFGASFIRRLLQIQSAHEDISEWHLQKLSGVLNAPHRMGEDVVGFRALHALFGADPSRSGAGDPVQEENALRDLHRRQESLFGEAEQALAGMHVGPFGIFYLFPPDLSAARGLIGRFATKINNEHKKPTVIGVQVGDAVHGSARAKGIDLIAWLDYLRSKGLDVKGGGHKEAVGFSLPAAEWAALEGLSKDYFGAARADLPSEDVQPADVVVHADDLVEFYRDLPDAMRRLAPFGVENPPISAIVYGFDQFEALEYEHAIRGIDRTGGLIEFRYDGKGEMPVLDPTRHIVRLEVSLRESKPVFYLKEKIDIQALALRPPKPERPRRLIDALGMLGR